MERHGASLAFAVPGVLMLLATLVFWSGRCRFVHIPPAGIAFVRQAVSGEGLRVLIRLAAVYLFVAVFWQGDNGAGRLKGGNHYLFFTVIQPRDGRMLQSLICNLADLNLESRGLTEEVRA